MAYFQKREEENNNNQNTNQTGSGYQTSSSEVGTNTSLMNDNANSNRQNNISNQSGNWVNLNDYIKANEGKSGKYASTLVDEKVQQSNNLKNDTDTAFKSYEEQIKTNKAYSTDPNKSNSVISSYMVNSGKVSDDDYGIVGGVLAGSEGINDFKSSKGYSDVKNQANDINTFSGKLDSGNGRMSLMNPNLNQGAKLLNNLLLTSSDAQNVFNNAKSSFKDMEDYLNSKENQANALQADVSQKADTNAQQTKSQIESISKQQKDAIEKRYNEEKAKAEQIKNDKNQYIEYYTYPYTNRKGETFYVRIPVRKNWNPTETNAATNKENELKEVDRRVEDLLTGNRSGATTFDLDNMSFGNYTSKSDAEKVRAGQRIQNALNNMFINTGDMSGIVGGMLAVANTGDMLRTLDPNASLDNEFNSLSMDVLDAYLNNKINDNDLWTSLLLLNASSVDPQSEGSRQLLQGTKDWLNTL